jgi:hypothetical protein
MRDIQHARRSGRPADADARSRQAGYDTRGVAALVDETLPR